MKKIMEMLQNMKAKNEKKDNKGFSLVELIIVIAIMAILVGVVGTQVLPYINKSKVAKDQQVLNSISTAAVTAFSENAEKVTSDADITITDVFTAVTGDPAESIQKDIITACGFKDLAAFKKALGSDGKDTITAVKVVFDQKNHKVTTSVTYTDATKVKYPIKNVEATL